MLLYRADCNNYSIYCKNTVSYDWGRNRIPQSPAGHIPHRSSINSTHPDLEKSEQNMTITELSLVHETQQRRVLRMLHCRHTSLCNAGMLDVRYSFVSHVVIISVKRGASYAHNKVRILSYLYLPTKNIRYKCMHVCINV